MLSRVEFYVNIGPLSRWAVYFDPADGEVFLRVGAGCLVSHGGAFHLRPSGDNFQRMTGWLSAG